MNSWQKNIKLNKKINKIKLKMEKQQSKIKKKAKLRKIKT